MHKLRYMALGGLLVFIGMLTASVMMPSLVAQYRFNAIECTKLTIVGASGDKRIEIAPYMNGGHIDFYDRFGTSQIHIGHWGINDKHGGADRVIIRSDYDNGGYIEVNGPASQCAVSSNDEGAYVSTYRYQQQYAKIGVNEWRSYVSVDGPREPMRLSGNAILEATKAGGRVEVSSDGLGFANLKIDEAGNGTLSLRDTNGNGN